MGRKTKVSIDRHMEEQIYAKVFEESIYDCQYSGERKLTRNGPVCEGIFIGNKFVE